MTWLDEYAEALSAASGRALSLSSDELGTMLRLAREVAHRTERKFAPVSTFLAGKFVAERLRQGGDADRAAAEALDVATGMLPPPAPEPDRA
ncbi:MAG: DUF6457 domain-containing protein [Actinomycetota bacterium]